MATHTHSHEDHFGKAANVVHTDVLQQAKSVIGSVSAIGKQVSRLGRRLFRKRELQQHFAGNVLFRTMRLRTVTQGKIITCSFAIGFSITNASLVSKTSCFST